MHLPHLMHGPNSSLCSKDCFDRAMMPDVPLVIGMSIEGRAKPIMGPPMMIFSGFPRKPAAFVNEVAHFGADPCKQVFWFLNRVPGHGDHPLDEGRAETHRVINRSGGSDVLHPRHHGHGKAAQRDLAAGKRLDEHFSAPCGYFTFKECTAMEGLFPQAFLMAATASGLLDSIPTMQRGTPSAFMMSFAPSTISPDFSSMRRGLR